MSQARLPRTEPSTELISAHKVNHRAAHVAGRAPGIFAGAGLHRGIKSEERRRMWRDIFAIRVRGEKSLQKAKNLLDLLSAPCIPRTLN